MTYVLRPYQQEAVEASVRHFEHGKGNGLLILPTGSGKSLVIAGIAAALGQPLLAFQPSKEILEQNRQKMRAYGIRPAVYSASAGSRDVGPITLATIGTVYNRFDSFPPFRYVLIDECHGVNPKEGMYKAVLEAFGSRVLGLTATPYRLTSDGFGGSILKFLTRTRPRVFDQVVHVTQLAPLFQSGHLARLTYQEAGTFRRESLPLNSTGADFDDAGVRRYYKEIHFQAQVLTAVRESLSRRRNALVFTRFVEEAQAIAAAIPGAAMVSAQTPPREREDLIARFRAGEIRCICNVGILTTGFDYPELDTAILARPTMSLALYYQMIGRIMRPHPAKAEALVVDLCRNVRQFGRIEDLEVRAGEHEKWAIHGTGGRQLTNVYFGQRRIEISAGAKASPCRGCGSRIFWQRTSAGKWTPLNPDGSSHWGTCSRRAQFKRTKGAA